MGALHPTAALAVGVGAGLGGLARWALSTWLNPAWKGFPLGTLLVNWLGGLGMGLAMAWLARHPDEGLRLLLVTGFLGGFTTFSAFSLESLHLLQKEQWLLWAVHGLGHVLGALAACALGWRLMRGGIG
ncbi:MULTISPECIES: fluoride efflux transporter CrcB [Caldimonas]|uniref:fluoride efflux transporter CrcB n=1 Tax=Caldimonas TaxID=196013 RepID=UPI00037FD344|nr:MULTISPECIES: fluoride efflux transporter CrcB [Caldimonas]GIX25312.1 MAG: putative fluoride ion transporter CrcB [Caldimonas sp.]